MGVLNSEINFDLILTDLGNCCMGETACGSCTKEKCIIGYAKTSLTKCFKDGTSYVENGSENIPVEDFKIFPSEELEKAIAHILRQCKSCQKDHFDNCVINVLRNCYEVGLFGEVQAYEGSAFRYLNQIHNSHTDAATNIIEEFHASKEE